MTLPPDTRFSSDRMASLAALARADGLALVVVDGGGAYRTAMAHNVPLDTRWGDASAAAVGRALAQRAPTGASGVTLHLADGRVATALAAAPVLWKERGVGALVALVVGDVPTAEDAEALTRVASLVAVQMAELGAAEEDRRQALALYELARFAALADPASELESAMRMVAEVLRHDVVGVWTASGEALQLRAAIGYGATPAADTVAVDAMLAQVLRERRTVKATFAATDRRPAWAGTAGLHFLVSPIAGERGAPVLGALVLGRARAPYLTGDDELAAMIADQLAAMVRPPAEAPCADTASERRRIAQEIHDGIAQELTGVVLALEGCQSAIDVAPRVLRTQLAKAARDARATLSDVRQYMAALRQEREGGPLDLQVRLARLVDELRQNGIQVELAEVGRPRTLEPHLERAVMRIASEALRNVEQHSGATKARLAVRYDDDQVVVAVEDEGQGFDPGDLDTAEDRGHFGVVGIRERAEAVGGELMVRSERGKGTVVRASLPYRAGDAAAPGEAVVRPARAGDAEGDRANLIVRLLGR